MDAITFSHEETDSKGRYVAVVDGFDAVGELTYSKSSPTLIIVDHTGVPDSLRGKGVGKALSAKIVEGMRVKGVKIVPLCPFFKAIAQRHSDWADVVQ